MVLLTTVESSFEVTGRNCCWVVPALWKSGLKIREKDKIQLRTPDGRLLNSEIGWITTGKSTSGRSLAIGLPRPIKKEDIPEGTEIWLDECAAAT